MEPLGKQCNACNAAQCTFPSMTHSSSGRRRFRPDWVVTSLRNADVTWPRCARRLSCCQAAERRIAWFASFVSNDSLAQPRRLPDRRFINFTWAEHLLKGSLWATGGELARSRGCLALLIGKVKAERGRWLWLCVLPNIASFIYCVRAHFHLATATAPNLPLDRFHRIETSYSQAAA